MSKHHFLLEGYEDEIAAMEASTTDDFQSAVASDDEYHDEDGSTQDQAEATRQRLYQAIVNEQNARQEKEYIEQELEEKHRAVSQLMEHNQKLQVLRDTCIQMTM